MKTITFAALATITALVSLGALENADATHDFSGVSYKADSEGLYEQTVYGFPNLSYTSHTILEEEIDWENEDSGIWTFHRSDEFTKSGLLRTYDCTGIVSDLRLRFHSTFFDSYYVSLNGECIETTFIDGELTSERILTVANANARITDYDQNLTPTQPDSFVGLFYTNGMIEIIP